MPAADVSGLLEDSALEGLPRVEAALTGSRVADLIALGASTEDLDERVAAAVDFTIERLRVKFLTPALATKSRAEFLDLWKRVGWEVLRLMTALDTLIHEGGQAHGSPHIFRRLELGDRHVISNAVLLLDSHMQGSSHEGMRATLNLIEDARVRVRDFATRFETTEDLDDDQLTLLDLFHTHVLLWGASVQLCVEIAARMSSLVDEQIRPTLITDALEFVDEGARHAGLYAAMLAGLKLSPFPRDYLRQSSTKTRWIAILLRASEMIPRTFGPETRYGLGLFEYPDEPEAEELQLVIDTPLDAKTACDRFEQLCEEWWDEAVAALDFPVHLVLGSLADA